MKKTHLRFVHLNHDDTNTSNHSDDYSIRELAAEEHEQIEAIWQPAEMTFERAYVSAVLDLEWWSAKSFRHPRDISAALRIVEEARQHPRFLSLFLATPFQRPSVLDFRLWRLRHEESEIVRASRINSYDLNRCEDKESMLLALGGACLWSRVRDEVHSAIAKSIRFVDPSINRCTEDDQIAPVVQHVLRKCRYDPYIEIDMKALDELLR